MEQGKQYKEWHPNKYSRVTRMPYTPYSNNPHSSEQHRQ